MDVKEEYMRSMSGLVKSNSGRLKQFVQQLVQVDQKDGKTAYMTVQMVRAWEQCVH